MRSAYTILEGPRLQLRNPNSKITQGLQPLPTLLLHLVVHRPTNKICSVCTLCTTKVYTARDDICAGNRQLHIKAQSNCTRAHPSIPRPPQPCLGVKFKTTVRCSPLRTKTLISFCKHDEHEFGATLPHDQGPKRRARTFSFWATTSARGCRDEAVGKDVCRRCPNLTTRSSRWRPFTRRRTSETRSVANDAGGRGDEFVRRPRPDCQGPLR